VLQGPLYKGLSYVQLYQQHPDLPATPCRSRGLLPYEDGKSISETPERARDWALWEVGTLVQRKLRSETFPQLYRTPEGYREAWGFRSLLGAIYLQMMFLMRATGKVRYCKGPGCTNIISFDQPQQPSAPKPNSGACKPTYGEIANPGSNSPGSSYAC
jgi:hypothetical protein